MSIQEHLNKIRSAIKGSEVRESIAKGIETAYDDASENGNANMEVKIARGTNPNLNTRLNNMEDTDRQNTERIDSNYNEVTAQLAQTKNELSRKPSKGETDWADLDIFDEETRAVIQGLSEGEINAVLGEKNVQRLNIADEAVGESQVSFIEKSSNIYNHKTDLIGYSLNNSTGEIEENAVYATTTFIEVPQNEKINAYGFTKVLTYDKNKERVGFVQLAHSGADFTPAGNVSFIRLTYAINNTDTPRQINIGENLLPYEPFYNTLTENISVNNDNIEDKSIDSSKLKDNSVQPINTTFLNKTNNLFNKYRTRTGIYQLGGTYDESNISYETSTIQPVIPNTEYVFTGISYLSLFSGDQYIERRPFTTLDENVITIPENVDRLEASINLNLTSTDNVQFNQGNELLEYEPFGYSFIEEIDVGEKEKETDLWIVDRYVIDGVLRGQYTAPKMSGFDNPYAIPRADVIGWYDDLVHEFGGEKFVLDVDGLGDEIYGFKFPTPRVPNEYDGSNERLNEKTPKMILISGVHGQERAGIFNLYNTVKEILSNWKSNELLETIRFNVDLIIVPIVNNYGFDNAVRRNENDVDLNRNFSYRWEFGSDNPESSTYRGEYPLSEKGAQAVTALLEEHAEDTILFVSHHNFGSGGGFVWNAAATKMQIHLTKKLIGKLTRKWQKEYDWIPQESDFYVGYANDGAPNGSEARFAASLGIQAGDFEIAQSVPYEDPETLYNDTTFTLGLETLVEWLVINLRENIKLYNS